MEDQYSLNKNHPAWIGVAIGFYAFIAIGIAEGGLGVLLPSILATYDLNPATVTLLFISQISGYVVSATTSSLISSRFGLARMLLFAAATLTTALVIYALSPYWVIMVAAGTLLGLGIGLIDAGINTYIVNDPRHAHRIGQLHAFYGVGALLGPTIATTLLAIGLHWRMIYLVIASIVGLLVIGVFGAVLMHYRPMMVQIAPADRPATANFRIALKTPIVFLTGLMLLIYVGTEVSIGNWAYTVQSVARGMPELAAGYGVSAYWMGLTFGRFILGYGLKRLGAVRAIDLSLILLSTGLLMWWWFPQLWLTLPLLGFSLAAIFPSTIWLIPHRLPGAIVPAAVGFVTSVASLGAATVPSIVGWIANEAGLEIIPPLMLPLAGLLVVLHRWLLGFKVVEDSPASP
ncbi:MAG: MFS transporter [Elainellaceae cyanobacterium]